MYCYEVIIIYVQQDEYLEYIVMYHMYGWIIQSWGSDFQADSIFICHVWFFGRNRISCCNSLMSLVLTHAKQKSEVIFLHLFTDLFRRDISPLLRIRADIFCSYGQVLKIKIPKFKSPALTVFFDCGIHQIAELRHRESLYFLLFFVLLFQENKILNTASQFW